MRSIMALMAVFILVACGADGEPVRPTAHTNVNISPSGVSAGTNLRIGQGPLSVNVGLGL